MLNSIAAPPRRQRIAEPQAADRPATDRPITLMRHQHGAVELARKFLRFAFFWACGLGKTIAIFAILDDERRRLGAPIRTLVVAPSSLLKNSFDTDGIMLGSKA